MTGIIEKKGLEKLAEKAAEFLSEIINPPLKELGGLLTDQVKFWRFKNQVDIVLKAQHFLDEKGIQPRKVPVRMLAPLLEHGSWEEASDRQTKWASLLANAANPNCSYDSYSSYVEILRQISPLEAKFLDLLFDEYGKPESQADSSQPPHKFSLGELYKIDLNNIIQFTLDGTKAEKVLGVSKDEFNILIDNLYRLDLVGGDLSPERIYPYVQLHFTSLGYNFVRSCRFR
ncbi:MAG: Abi-alpha family protein [Ignavibacteriales bacterium]